MNNELIECENCGEDLTQGIGNCWFHRRNGQVKCRITFAKPYIPEPEVVYSPEMQARLDTIMDDFLRVRAVEGDTMKYFERMFKIYIDINPRLIKNLIFEHRDILENRDR